MLTPAYQVEDGFGPYFVVSVEPFGSVFLPCVFLASGSSLTHVPTAGKRLDNLTLISYLFDYF